MDALEEMKTRIQAKSQALTSTNTSRSCSESDVCPICRGSGWEMFKENGDAYCRECRCGIRQKQIMENRIRFADIPRTFEGIRLDSFDVAAYNAPESRNRADIALKAINYWLNDLESMKRRGMGLYIHSKTKGSGKTRMSISIANELMHRKNMQVKFATSLQILNEVKASWDRECSPERTESRLLDFLSTTEVLIIDDLGVERGEREWVREKFYHIINNRYIEKMITIFTSNQRVDMLDHDDRITGRIRERTFQIPFPEESVRNTIAKKNMDELVRAVRK